MTQNTKIHVYIESDYCPPLSFFLLIVPFNTLQEEPSYLYICALPSPMLFFTVIHEIFLPS